MPETLPYTNYSWGKLLYSICLVILAFLMFVGSLSWACTPPLLSGRLAELELLNSWTHIHLEPVDLRKTTVENRCYLFLHPRIFICSVQTPQKVKASQHVTLKIKADWTASKRVVLLKIYARLKFKHWARAANKVSKAWSKPLIEVFKSLIIRGKIRTDEERNSIDETFRKLKRKWRHKWAQCTLCRR